MATRLRREPTAAGSLPPSTQGTSGHVPGRRQCHRSACLGAIDSLLGKDVRIEACQISCDWVGTPAETMLDDIVVIDNAFAASIFYQTQGYALVPVTELP